MRVRGFCFLGLYNNQFPPPAKRQSPRRLLINCQNSYSNIIKIGYVLAEYAAKARVVMHKTKQSAEKQHHNTRNNQKSGDSQDEHKG